MPIDIETVIEQSKHANAEMRTEAVRMLCPCKLKFNYEPAWNRLLEMVTDPDVHVRRNVLHVLCDGSPRERETEVVQALERMYHDKDAKLRRHVRKLLAQYKRGGRINVL